MGAGVVVVICSDFVVVLYGAGPQPDRIATLAISAAQLARRTVEVILFMG